MGSVKECTKYVCALLHIAVLSDSGICSLCKSKNILFFSLSLFASGVCICVHVCVHSCMHPCMGGCVREGRHEYVHVCVEAGPIEL